MNKPKIEVEVDWISLGLGFYYMRDMIDFHRPPSHNWNHSIIVMIGPITIGVLWD